MNGLRHNVRLRSGNGFVAVASALGCLVAAVPAAEASFPGRNGVLAFGREGGLGKLTISVVDPLSGRTRAVTHVPRRCAGYAIWDDSDPSFSASGRLLVYTHVDDCDPRTPDGTYVIRPDGRGRRLVTRKLLDHPVFSPSGELVAAEDERDRTRITDVDHPERERELLPSARYSITKWPAWSATGRLALTVGANVGTESGHIATVTSQGADLRLVTRSRRDVMPDWSPAGDRIAFAREKGNRSDILVASSRTRGNRPKRLTHTRDASFPVWSPNGRDIAYVRGNSIFEPGSLVIVRARDGERERLIETHVDVLSRISWQPRPQP